MLPPWSEFKLGRMAGDDAPALMQMSGYGQNGNSTLPVREGENHSSL